MSDEVLVGDVGGTNARFGVASCADGAIDLQAFRKLEGDKFTTFDDAMAAYLQNFEHTPRHALIAVAGVLTGGDVALTNRDWLISPSALKAKFGFESVRLVNDFAAMARAVPEIAQDALEVVRAGTGDPAAPLLVAGAGTGLGMATLLPDVDGRWCVISGEGGHCAFAAQTELEFQLAGLLRNEFGYVSNELVCSGMGMVPVHRGLCQLASVPYDALSPQEVLDRASAGDAICLDVCNIRARALMGAVGDGALTNATWGGVVMAGGVTQRLFPYLQRVDSLARFNQRGPRASYMAKLPIWMLIDETAPLIGASALFFEA